ncbi:MAG: hypothetical protein KDA41_22165 [Planctomycetales bacterium]|nr:hypothetical protein [Planctomycetales bacterium]
MAHARRCIVLFSGGLDSMLAVRILQEQGVAVEALNFKTIFTCCQDQAGQAAHKLGVPLTVFSQEDDYLDLVRKPRFGYGKGANPCVDCRIYMFERALGYLRRSGADFLASGEVVGQRPMSQKRRDLDVIAHHSGGENLLLRPLCAKRLPPTLPEREGWVDRDGLYDFVGRSRKPLIALARRLGIEEIPAPSNGCALTEKQFAHKVHDLIQLEPAAGRWDYELLLVGRHFRFGPATKVVVGRTESDNAALAYLHELPESRSAALLRPVGFRGPTVLVVGDSSDAAIDYAVGMIVRYGAPEAALGGAIEVSQAGGTRMVEGQASPAAEAAKTLAAAR